MAGTITVPEFTPITQAQLTDLLYAIRGTGLDRDRNMTVDVLNQLIGDVLLEVTTTGPVDLSTYTTNLFLKTNSASPITVTISNTMSEGKTLIICNLGVGDATISIEGLSIDLPTGATLKFVSNGANMIRLLSTVGFEWRGDTFAGFGSTDTKIAYVSNVRVNKDPFNKVTVVNDGTNGLRITIDKAMSMSLAATWRAPGGSLSNAGFSLNSSELTTNINTITVADRLQYSTAAQADATEFSVAGDFDSGDILRFHTDGLTPGNVNQVHFHAKELINGFA